MSPGFDQDRRSFLISGIAALLLAGCETAGGADAAWRGSGMTAREVPEGIDPSYNPDQVQAFNPMNADITTIGRYEFQNGWLRLYIATLIRADLEVSREEARRSGVTLLEEAVSVAKQRDRPYVALLGARAYRLYREYRGAMGGKTTENVRFITEVTVAFGSVPGRGWMTHAAFSISARQSMPNPP